VGVILRPVPGTRVHLAACMCCVCICVLLLQEQPLHAWCLSGAQVLPWAPY
jgi:hypothetical protein